MSASSSEEFQVFWDNYPRKEAKMVAQKAFVKAVQKVTPSASNPKAINGPRDLFLMRPPG